MKKIYVVIVLVPLLFMQGCDKFLDIKPENVKVVSSVEDYRDLLASYMRYLKTPNRNQKHVLGAYNYPVFDVATYFAFRTGELSPYKQSGTYYDPALGEYTQLGVERLTWMENADYIWDSYYSFLGPINMIISGLDTAIGDDEDMRNYVKGEALVWRAYAYLKLLEYFSPYKNNEYGIPIWLKIYEDPASAMPSREKQSDVYKQIIADCEEVLKLLDKTPFTNWNCAYQPCFVNSMLAHIYWYKSLSAAAEDTDWENALKYAEQVMVGRTFVRDPVIMIAMFDATAGKEFTNDEFNVRLIDGDQGWLINVSGKYYQGSSYNIGAEASPDADFYALFKDDDVRKNAYFKKQLFAGVRYDKYNVSASMNFLVKLGLLSAGGIIMPFRSAEMQLIKAEALYRLNKMDEAKIALDFFKQGRYLDIDGSYTESDLLNEILKERKLEFYHEQDMWWLDMKRLGKRVERVINGTLHVLEPDDYRYCFPIPLSEMEKNKNMVQNPGWDKVNF